MQEALKNPATLYQQPFLNYRGSVDGVRYTEIAAEEILKNLDVLKNNIKTITRTESYKTEGHKELAERKKPEGTNRDEEWIAINMYGKEFELIGEILDFQVPLKDKSDDKAGKIDLLSYKECHDVAGHGDEDELVYYDAAFILELKKQRSAETLLRCILEAYTYGEIVDTEKLLKDFGKLVDIDRDKLVKDYGDLITEDSLRSNFVSVKGSGELHMIEVLPAILVFRNSQANKDFISNISENLMVKSLMRQLGVSIYALNKDATEVINKFEWWMLPDFPLDKIEDKEATLLFVLEHMTGRNAAESILNELNPNDSEEIIIEVFKKNYGEHRFSYLERDEDGNIEIFGRTVNTNDDEWQKIIAEHEKNRQEGAERQAKTLIAMYYRLGLRKD